MLPAIKLAGGMLFKINIMSETIFERKPEEYLNELKLELGMRRKVWKRRSGGGAKFVDKTHQQRYDTLEELLLLLEVLGGHRVELLQLKASEITRAQMELFGEKQSES